jgi:hypothetical protein
MDLIVGEVTTEINENDLNIFSIEQKEDDFIK